MAIYVLLHGAWAGGWQWRQVARLLHAHGHEAFTPTFTGLGERVHLLNPNITFETHVQDVLGVLTYEDLWDVTLVGFSYSGMVITAVAERVPERLAQLIYVDAFAPEDGQSLLSMFKPEVAAEVEAIARHEGDGWRVPRLPADALTTSRPNPRRTAQPLSTFRASVAVRDPRATRLPRAYIYCTDKSDLGSSGSGIAASAARARAEGWRYHELPTTHVAMETMPEELTTLLVAIEADRTSAPPLTG